MKVAKGHSKRKAAPKAAKSKGAPMSAGIPTSKILKAQSSISAVLDGQPVLDPENDIAPHPRDSDGDSFYIISYLEGGGHKYTVLFHLMVIVKSLGTPVAQLVISVFDETTREYFSRELNEYWLNNTTVVPAGLDITMPWGRLSGTIDQLNVEGHLADGAVKLDMKLTMAARGPVLPNLVTGIIPFSDGIDYEYALPRMETSGQLTIHGAKCDVKGWSWLDREWGRFGPSKWTWMNIQLENGVQISLWDEQINDSNPNSYVGGPRRFATILNPDDGLIVAPVVIKELRNWISPKTKRTYATRWSVTIPERAELTVELLKDDQEIVSAIGVNRIEGKARVSGTYGKEKVNGVTMVEMCDLFPLFQTL
ncbi:MAG: lipocalin family protein [Candidatus Binatus sp.]